VRSETRAEAGLDNHPICRVVFDQQQVHPKKIPRSTRSRYCLSQRSNHHADADAFAVILKSVE
jgi:hypothetical protein